MENKLTSLEQMRQAMQEAAGLSREVAAAAAGAIQEVAEAKQDKLAGDGTVKLTGEVIGVAEPTRVVTRAEYDALPEEEKSRGLFIIEDEDGTAGGVEMATELPQAAGEASAGTSERCAREDHVHPAQTDITGNAATATMLKNARIVDGVPFSGSISISHYGTCDTAAEEAEKVVKKLNGGFVRTPGAVIAVKFANTNKAKKPTLKIGTNDASPIMIVGETPVGDMGTWAEGEIVEFIYDGTNFVTVNGAVRGIVYEYMGQMIYSIQELEKEVLQIKEELQQVGTLLDNINGEVV